MAKKTQQFGYVEPASYFPDFDKKPVKKTAKKATPKKTVKRTK